jgi:hypothetical protein
MVAVDQVALVVALVQEEVSLLLLVIHHLQVHHKAIMAEYKELLQLMAALVVAVLVQWVQI